MSRIMFFLLFFSTLLPAQETTPRVCGFSQQFTGQISRESGKPLLQKIAAPLRDYQVTTPPGHFILHYDLEGFHAVSPVDAGSNGIPDYIDSAMVILEQVWTAEIDQLGFNPPPAIDGQPVAGYPVYFTRFDDNTLYGVTWVDEPVTGSGETRFTSYLELRYNYDPAGFFTKGLDAMRVTAAHEFHHAVQLGYYLRLENDFPVDIFLMEMTSVWMEDQVYNHINDYYQYLPYLFQHAGQYALDSFDQPQMAYGHALFLKMLTEKYQPDLIRRIWEQIPENTGLSAVNKAVQTVNSSFSTEFRDYASWFFFTGQRTVNGYYFEDALNYPLLPETNSFSFDTELSLSGALPARQMTHYFLSAKTDSVVLAKIGLTSEQSAILGSVLTGEDRAGLGFSPGEQKSFFINPQAEIYVALANAGETDAEEWRIDILTAERSLTANPLVIRAGNGQLRFYGLTAGAQIDLYSLNGVHLGTANSTTGSTETVMDVHDFATGVYLYAIRGSGGQSIGKVAIIRK